MQGLIEVEATDVIGAEKWERTIDRVAHRNDYRPRVASTKAGDLQLGIPKFDRGSFFPEVLESRKRIDQAVYAVVVGAYVHGVSTLSVDKVVTALGVDSGISRSEVSRICSALDERLNALRNRTLGHTSPPYVSSRAVVVATGITAEGGREILGVDTGDSSMADLAAMCDTTNQLQLKG